MVTVDHSVWKDYIKVCFILFNLVVQNMILKIYIEFVIYGSFRTLIWFVNKKIEEHT